MPKTIFTDESLLKAYLDCRKTKRRTMNALKFEMTLEGNLFSLKEELLNRTYKPGRSICFIVERPKPREIFAADFRDRVVHHILVNEVQDLWEKGIFIEDSYACRPGKGHHFGVERVSRFAKRYRWFGQFDIKNFFASIDKTNLFKCFSEPITEISKPSWWRQEVLWLAGVIIFADPAQNYYYKGNPKLRELIPPEKSLVGKDGRIGMPIGNLTSQFLANVYLNELDHFVKGDLGVEGYGRYVDDFVVFSNSRKDILSWRNCMNQFLKTRLRLTLHPAKQQIQPSRHGVPFAGYFIKPWGVTVRRNVVKNLKNKMFYWEEEQNLEKAISSVNSYFGHFLKAKSRSLRKHLVEEHLPGEIKNKIAAIGDYHHLKARG